MTPSLLSGPLRIDPLAAAASLAGEPGTILFLRGGAAGGRVRSALLFDPRWTLHADPGGVVWRGDVPAADVPARPDADLPLALASLWPAAPPSPAPVFAGLAGYLGYDLGPATCGTRHASPPPFDLPDLWLGAYDAALVFTDTEPPELVVADLAPLVPATTSLERRFEEATAVLEAAAARPLRSRTAPGPAEVHPPDPRWHASAVERIQSHLRAGDAYQINLTAHVTAVTDADPWVVFSAEHRRNPVAFAAYLRTDRAAVTSHSPERLLRIVGNVADTQPIKGTIAAGPGDRATLLASQKDRAEHVMIVDLCRNDLGRICEYGSVHVPELMEPLSLRGLVHLVSRIEGQLLPGVRDCALGSLFPGGSITGAPKRRAMEIITAVERSRRGPYTGSVGYVDRQGWADWNIAIRTAVWQNGSVAFGSGGGIVLDSDADAEYAEVLLKTSSFLETLVDGRALGGPVPRARETLGDVRGPGW